jgi:tRNA modification GTPase
MEHGTIAAVATPPGRGGVGIVRISGPDARAIGEACSGKTLTPRRVHVGSFRDADGEVVDHGVILFFEGPHSFTGEDVVELQGHGGPVVCDAVLAACLSRGAKMAEPGAFSYRAFMHGKMDLTQAEAVADLIDAGSHTAAKAALNSLQGAFAKAVQGIIDSIMQLRMWTESALDFSDEDIDLMHEGGVTERIAAVLGRIQSLQKEAEATQVLREGMKVVLLGKPNVGKSSLMNALCGFDAAIVSDVAGTTRDLLREHIHIDGMPVHVVDTAGLREGGDAIEQEGMRRAAQAWAQADGVLWVVDQPPEPGTWPEGMPQAVRDAVRSGALYLVLVHNKIDLGGEQKAFFSEGDDAQDVFVSAKSGEGIDALKAALKKKMAYQDADAGVFMARRRHVDALQQAEQAMAAAYTQAQSGAMDELVAQDVWEAQRALCSITGEITPDDVLGAIFSHFCVGK